jgi:hypothetical protein
MREGAVLADAPGADRPRQFPTEALALVVYSPRLTPSFPDPPRFPFPTLRGLIPVGGSRRRAPLKP